MKKLVLLFIVLLGLAGCSTSDEDSDTVKIGVIQFSEHIALDKSREGFLDEMENRGYDLEVDFVNVQSDLTLIPVTINKFEAQDVDIIYAIATTAAQGAKHVSRDTPVIFNAVTDPEGSSLVDSNDKPGGNITGVSDYFSIEKQLDLFLEDFPDTKDLGLIYSTGEINSEAQIRELQEAVDERGINLHAVGVTTTNDIPSALASLLTKVDAYVQIQDNLAASAAEIIAAELVDKGIPSFSGESGSVEGGLLLSDGIDYYQLGRLAADQAELILAGENPGEIPVEFSEESGRVVNIDTYNKLGLEKKALLEDAELVE